MRDKTRITIIAMVFIIAIMAGFTYSELASSTTYVIHAYDFASGNVSLGSISTNYRSENSFSQGTSTENKSSSSYLISEGLNALIRDLPSITLNYPGDGIWLNLLSIGFNFTPNYIGYIDNCSLLIDGVVNQTSVVTKDEINTITTSLSDGSYQWSIRCTDEENQINSSVERDLYIDITSPEILLNNPLNNTLSGTESNTFSFTPTDINGVDNCSLLINDEINKTSSFILNGTINSLSANLPTEGYYWKINCTDTVNNENSSETRYFEVDITSPTIYINVTPSTTEFGGDSSEINWTIIDLNSDYDYLTVYYPSGIVMDESIVNTTLTRVNLTEIGNYSLTVWANDSANNVATSTEYLLVQDTIAPNMTAISPNNRTIFNVSDVNFEFNVSDLHTVDNCSLYINGTANQTSSFNNNELEVQFFNLTNYPDGELIEWNISCVDNSSNENVTVSRYIDVDTSSPIIDFSSDSYPDNFYLSSTNAIIIVDITEPHLSSILFNWNGTDYWFNTSSETEGNVTYNYDEINKTFLVDNLVEGTYEYYIFANDTLLYENTSETRTITIDTTYPGEFVLISPVSGSETTDSSPAFNWNDTIEANLDNYTLEISSTATFDSIQFNASADVSNYQLSDDNALANGIWYWRVIAKDKANNDATSNTFELTVGAVEETTTVIGPGGGGGGSGGKITSPGVVNVIQPGPLTMFTEDSIITPIYIKNDGNTALKGVKLTAESSSPDIELTLYEDTFPIIHAKSKVATRLKITSKNAEGQYDITVKANVDSPLSTDQMKFFVNLIGFGKGNQTLIEEKLLFIGRLFESNPECLELKELVDQANDYLAMNMQKEALSSIETAIESCNMLIQEIEGVEREYTKPTEPRKTMYILIAEILAFFIVFSFVYRYFRKRKQKDIGIIQREAMKKRKPMRRKVFALLFIAIIIAGGFLFLKETYTGFFVFSQDTDTEFNRGTHTQTQTDGENITLLNDTLNTYYTDGNYVSGEFNANYTADWQEIVYEWANSTDADNVTIQTRTSDDNVTWGGWSANLTNGTFIKINATWIQYKATLLTDDNTKTPYLMYVNISYDDASFPSFEFVDPTPEDSLCTIITEHFINVSLTEANEDTFGISFNNTNYTYTNNTYWYNATNLTEGTYKYYVFANDTYNHTNQSETRNFTIDLSNPGAFNLLNPTEENRTTESTPFFNWGDTTDPCFDNYTVEISETEDFETITYKFTNTSSNYQINSSESLANDTFYWRVVAYDKLGNNYTTSSTSFDVGLDIITLITPGTSGAGGGGGKKVRRVVTGLELITPTALSYFADDFIIVPLKLVNNGTEVLKDINIKVSSMDLITRLSKTKQDILRPKQEVPISLTIEPGGKIGKFDITITSNVAMPEFSDSTKIFVDLYEFGTGNETDIKENIEFAADFIRQNEICEGLEEEIEKARIEFDNENPENANELAKSAFEKCKELVNSKKPKLLKEGMLDDFKKYLPIIESIALIFVFIALYSYYRRLKFKNKK